MFSFLRLSPIRPSRFIARTLGMFSLYLLVLVSSIYAQSVPGFQAPEKPSAALELPIQIGSARGEAPMSRIYDYLKVEPAKIRRLPALTPDEMRMDPSEKILRIGVVRSLVLPINPLTDSPPYRLVEGDVRVMGIVSEGALYTRVHFSSMSLPPGARVFVYSVKNRTNSMGLTKAADSLKVKRSGRRRSAAKKSLLNTSRDYRAMPAPRQKFLSAS